MREDGSHLNPGESVFCHEPETPARLIQRATNLWSAMWASQADLQFQEAIVEPGEFLLRTGQ